MKNILLCLQKGQDCRLIGVIKRAVCSYSLVSLPASAYMCTLASFTAVPYETCSQGHSSSQSQAYTRCSLQEPESWRLPFSPPKKTHFCSKINK